ncbi:MAG: hypothetical protein RLZZ387_591 [Chloroflexota bacterium]
MADRSPAPADIMIVDDTLLNLRLLCALLAERGYTARMFTRGGQSLVEHALTGALLSVGVVVVLTVLVTNASTR